LVFDLASGGSRYKTEEIHAANGAKVSRSEIIRAALAGLRELHTLASGIAVSRADDRNKRADLQMLSVVAARCATSLAVFGRGPNQEDDSRTRSVKVCSRQ
jgi:hypothetical protein